MGTRTVNYFPAILLLGVCVWCIQPARAALGGDAASVLADADEWHGDVHPAPQPGLDILEISAGGLMVREFLDRGVVFAVAWTGPVMPDLRRLLGANYAAYVAALVAQEQAGLKRSLRVATPELVVESGGHLRAYNGRAYLPALIPAGLSTSLLR